MAQATLKLDFKKLDEAIRKKAIMLGHDKTKFLELMGFGVNGSYYYRRKAKDGSITLTNKRIKSIEKHCGVKRTDFILSK